MFLSWFVVFDKSDVLMMDVNGNICFRKFRFATPEEIIEIYNKFNLIAPNNLYQIYEEAIIRISNQ